MLVTDALASQLSSVEVGSRERVEERRESRRWKDREKQVRQEFQWHIALRMLAVSRGEWTQKMGNRGNGRHGINGHLTNGSTGKGGEEVGWCTSANGTK